MLQVFDGLAQLRIAVFRDFPYLYEGTKEYEREYLETYFRSENALLFAAFDAGQMIGATTCIPLPEETDEVKSPFLKAGYDLYRIFYFGESVLLPQYRGLGLGHRFFDVREAHAASFKGIEHTCFCAVVRPEDHPLRPIDYRPLDAFWQKRGYTKTPDIESNFEWLDVGEKMATAKKMVYWMKQIH